MRQSVIHRTLFLILKLITPTEFVSLPDEKLECAIFKELPQKSPEILLCTMPRSRGMTSRGVTSYGFTVSRSDSLSFFVHHHLSLFGRQV